MLHYFNPGHETAILNRSKYYMAPANVVTMQNELSYLPAWYADNNDFILTDKKLPHAFIDYIAEKLNKSPLAITTDDIVSKKHDLSQQQVNLWGVSPQGIYFFESLNNDHQLGLSVPQWNDIYKTLCDRHTAQDCLKYIVERSDRYSDDIIPQFYTTLDQIEAVLSENSNTFFLAKAPFSSSGRGLLWLPIGKLTQTERQILHGHLKKQGSVSLERALDKRLDFAMEFISDNNTIRFEGFSLFQTNNRGAYTGNYLGSQNRITERITDYVSPASIEDTKRLLTAYLEKHIASVYTGCIGVDMMIYKENDEYKLHPCLEINVRNNMGFIALSISRNVLSENVEGMFCIDFSSKEESIWDNSKKLQNEYPPVFKDHKIISGYLPLCPVGKSNKYHAYILVGNNVTPF